MSMVSNETRNNIGAALARSSQDPVIFIVDDDVALRESLHGLFRDVRLQAEVFGSPTELLASRQPDAASCLVLDIRLPGMSGLDFQAELARANIDIPVIFITGYADIPMAVRAMKAGAVDFLTKPFREQDMLDAVATAIARDRMRRESERVASEMRARFETLSDEQASGRNDRARGSDGEDASRTGHEKDGSDVRRRSRQDGRDSRRRTQLGFLPQPEYSVGAQARKRRLPNTILSSNVAIERHG
jgi:FixJ family two-component response regulator